jgi:hypothetical protein
MSRHELDQPVFVAKAVCGAVVAILMLIDGGCIALCKAPVDSASQLHRLCAQFLRNRGEFFNTLNKTNFSAANGDRSSSSFGKITSTLPARQVQFALRLLF